MLDKVQIAALRQADVVSFHTRKETESPLFGPDNAESIIRCTKRNKVTATHPFADRDSVVEIPASARLQNYEPGHSTYYCGPYTGFAMEHTPQGSDTWQTIVSLLRVGDELTLQWSAGGLTSPYLADKGVVGDTLHLIVTRGEKKLTFLLDAFAGSAGCRLVKLQRQYSIA